jgi:PiT family inorganic phosphate transporter
MTPFLALVIVIVVVALFFDFLNGFHDAANSIATIVSTRVLTPAQAVAWAAFFNFISVFLFGTSVAKMVGKGMVDTSMIDVYVVFGGLIGAIVWNIITWLLALPTSSSHALMAGFAGAAVAKAGTGVLIAAGWVPMLVFIVLSPTIGFLLGAINMVAVAWIFRRSSPNKVDGFFRKAQLFSAAAYSLGHGTNDAQKTMGIIVALFAAAHRKSWAESHHTFLGREHDIALWVILSCTAAIALGTMAGGWRIVKTMGSGITRLAPVGGFCAETAGASTLIGTALFGIPVSTTHAITGAILGVGTTKGVRSVRWIWGQRIVIAWILTIPCAAFVAAVSYQLIHWCVQPFFSH